MKSLLRTFIYRTYNLWFWREYHDTLDAVTSPEKLSRFQDRYLRALLIHCYEQIPYYRRVFDECGVMDAGRLDIEKFQTIPPLTKDQIRNHRTELTALDLQRRRWFHNATGGSTGEALQFIQDRGYVRWSRAINHYYYHDMLGIDHITNHEVRLWGNERDIITGGLALKKRLRDTVLNITFLNSFRMSGDRMKAYIDLINREKPEIINGYAGSLFEVCRFARKSGISLHTPAFLASSAETLTEEMRSEIEETFHTRIHDFYGSREAENLAGQCHRGLYHLFLVGHVLEVVDNQGNPVKEGEEGRILVTPLHNYAMPFIRYEIGDVGVLGPLNCPCGNPLPTLKSIRGRVTDHFRSKDGTLIYGGYFTRLFIRRSWVKSFRIIQSAIDTIEIVVAPDGAIPEPERMEIEQNIRLVMGESCKILWYSVDQIPKTKSGKCLYTVSKVH